MSGPMRTERNATLVDVAAAAGVSRSTASRALVGSPHVTPAVRARVKSAADDLGYVVDTIARSLRKRDSMTFGLMVSNLRDPFYAELAAGISDIASDVGYSIALFDCAGDASRYALALESFLGARIAGALVTPFDSRFSESLLQHNIPVVELDRISGAVGAGAVVVDNVGGSFEATSALMAAGHSRIALIIDETEWSTGSGRLAGYRNALAASNLTVDDDLIVGCGFTVEDAVRAVRRLLERRPDVSAIFAGNNVIAEGAWRAIRDSGLRIPTDISLVSFDDSPWMTIAAPMVTCVRQPVFELGRRAVAHLIDLAAGSGAPTEIVLRTTFVERASIGTPAPTSRLEVEHQ